MHPLRWVLHLVANMAAVAIAAALLPGVAFTGVVSLILATVVLGIINTLIKPVVSLVTLPINIITLGIFGLLVNGFFVLLASALVEGFVVDSFWWALAFSVVLGLVSWFLHLIERR